MVFSIRTLFALFLGLHVAVAAPTPGNIVLARKYAPQWRFHPSEAYWPSTIEYFLSGPVKLTDSSGKVINEHLTPSNVDDAPNQGSGLFLSTDINAGKKGFLHGQKPSTTPTTMYTFIAPKANGVVDLFYWLFTPFNEGKSVPAVGEVGDHVGDWERMSVRTVNGVATQVDYHAHDGTGSGTLPWSQVIKFDNGQRPVGYVAKGSHGFWSKSGTFTYLNAVVFKLQDVTADGGVAWDVRDNQVLLNYPDTYSGNEGWLYYKGAWGNPGTKNCWWYFAVPQCEVVAGPGGPLRPDVLGAARTRQWSGMSGPLSQTLGTISHHERSSYTVFLGASVISLLSSSGSSNLAVQQTCLSRPAVSQSNNTNTILGSSTNNFAFISLTRKTRYTVDVAQCAQNYTVDSYTIGVCKGNTQAGCLWAPSSRTLRAFSDDSEDIQLIRGIIVNDLDVWHW